MDDEKDDNGIPRSSYGSRDEGRVLRNPKTDDSYVPPDRKMSGVGGGGIELHPRRNSNPLVGSWNRFTATTTTNASSQIGSCGSLRDNNGHHREQWQQFQTPKVEAQDEDEDYIPIRPRSPVQQIRRFRLNDPDIVSFADVQYRPYSGRKKQQSREYLQQQRQQKQPQTEQQLPTPPTPQQRIQKFNNPKNMRPHFTLKKQPQQQQRNAPNMQVGPTLTTSSFVGFRQGASLKTTGNKMCDVDYLTPEKKKLFDTNWYENNDNRCTILASQAVKEREFDTRCKELGLSYNWYKTKKSVDKATLENCTIEMTHNGIIYKISGGFDNPEVAKELAFIEGIRRINFLFGRKGRESEGALHHHQQRVAENNRVSQPDSGSSWQPVSDAFNPPPLPPFAPPKNPPLPSSPSPPLPVSTRSNSLSSQPAPPGTQKFAININPFSSNLNLFGNMSPKVQSSWSAMCNESGFFNIEKAPISSGNEASQIDAPYRGYFTTDSKPEPPKTIQVGPNEMACSKKIESVGLIYACYELPVDIKDGHEYYSFKVEFWDKKTPDFREKSWGLSMIIAKDARESAFGVALEKLLKIYPDPQENEVNVGNFSQARESTNLTFQRDRTFHRDIITSFDSANTSRMGSQPQYPAILATNAPMLSNRSSDEVCELARPVGQGRGRGLLLDGDNFGPGILDHRDWRWP